MRNFLILALCGNLTLIVSCGGSSSSGNNPGSGPATGANVQAVIVNSGVLNNYVNGIFTSVVVCVPGSSTCTTLNDILVDTGSYGLRVLASQVSALSLPQQTSAAGPIAECAVFADSVVWGKVRTADIKLSGETASSVAIQVIDDQNSLPVPQGCKNHSTNPPADSQALLLANGILGIGQFRQDCGGACTLTTSNPGNYYVCPTASTCTVTQEALSQQVQNPVWMFATDNNGTIVELPSVPAGGAPSVSGSLIFGIGTQSNNKLGSATVFPLDPNTGNFSTVYPANPPGNSFPSSFIDSGSNGLFFGSATSSLPLCPPSGSTPSGFYCPTSTQPLSATQQAVDGTIKTDNFSVANANNLSGSNFAFNDLAGPAPAGIFDWGLPFFFGRNLFTGIEGQPVPSVSGLSGPFYAY